jgi:hypothetical protein
MISAVAVGRWRLLLARDMASKGCLPSRSADLTAERHGGCLCQR